MTNGVDRPTRQIPESFASSSSLLQRGWTWIIRRMEVWRGWRNDFSGYIYNIVTLTRPDTQDFLLSKQSVIGERRSSPGSIGWQASLDVSRCPACLWREILSIDRPVVPEINYKLPSSLFPFTEHQNLTNPKQSGHVMIIDTKHDILLCPQQHHHLISTVTRLRVFYILVLLIISRHPRQRQAPAQIHHGISSL